MKKVLVVYSSFSFGKEVLPALINAGYEISTISDQGNVLAALHRDSYDLLVIEAIHPGHTSAGLLSDIRKINGYLLTPIIFTSEKAETHGHGDVPVPRHVEYLQTPVQPEQFLSVLTISTLKEREYIATSAGSQ